MTLELPISEHFQDLRKTILAMLSMLVASIIVVWNFVDKFLQLFLFSVQDLPFSLQLFSPLEGFCVSLKLALLLSLLISAPLQFYFLFSFLQPALHPKEKHFIYWGAGLLSFATLLGGGSGIFIVLPFFTRTLFFWNAPLGINLWGLNAFIDFALAIVFGCIVVMVIAMALFFLVHKGIINENHLRLYRRQAILAAFIIGAIVTPPDVISQAAMAFPLILSYEAALWYSVLFRKIPV